jgi:hypothetical protein
VETGADVNEPGVIYLPLPKGAAAGAARLAALSGVENVFFSTNFPPLKSGTSSFSLFHDGFHLVYDPSHQAHRMAHWIWA